MIYEITMDINSASERSKSGLNLYEMQVGIQLTPYIIDYKICGGSSVINISFNI